MCLGDIQNFKLKRDSSDFKLFTTNLIEFLNRLICDHLFLLEIPEFPKPVLYRVEYFGELLETTDGMFASIATITNFLIHFIDENDLLIHIIIIFRRLYNFFPKYRPNLEDQMLAIFLGVLKNYKKAAELKQASKNSSFAEK